MGTPIYYYRENAALINEDADADFTSAKVNCNGHASARLDCHVTGLTDAGTIDQTVELQGSVDGNNWNPTAIVTVSITGSSPLTASFYSTVADIRGYSWLRLVYTKQDATAGTILCKLNSIQGA